MLQSFSVEETTFCLLYPLEHENGLFLKGHFKTWLKNNVALLFLSPGEYHLHIALALTII